MEEPRFSRDQGFHREVRARVFASLSELDVRSSGGSRLAFKTLILLLWFTASYVGLVFVATSWWQGCLCAVSLALAMGGIGFCVQHDGNHGAYSSHRSVNRGMGMFLDLLGASSYLWRFKHNVAHHTFTNIAGADDDINLGVLARLSPAQPRRWYHRAQYIYLWPLYGLLMPKWYIVDDFKAVILGRIGSTHFRRPVGWDLAGFIAGKLAFFGWSIALPALFHPWWAVLLYFALVSTVLGFVLSVVFQLGHLAEEASFTGGASGNPGAAWAVHQVENTVDFAQGNPVLTWYLGGLNYQIEHHLFPHVSHLHYPAIAGVVQAACKDFGVRYTVHRTIGAALKSHVHLLVAMGRPPARRAGLELSGA